MDMKLTVQWNSLHTNELVLNNLLNAEITSLSFTYVLWVSHVLSVCLKKSINDKKNGNKKLLRQKCSLFFPS